MKTNQIKFKKQYKKLYKYHTKELKRLYNSGTKKFLDPMPYLVAYLKFMRDYLMLTNVDEESFNKSGLGTLIAALEAHDSYIQSCINIFDNIKLQAASNNDETAEGIREATAKCYTDIDAYYTTFLALFAEFSKIRVNSNFSERIE